MIEKATSEESLKTMELRFATTDDCRMVFEWRNQEEVYRYSFSPEPVTWEEHRIWFAGSLQNPFCDLLIAEYDGVPCGVIRFDLTDDSSQAEVSVYLATNFQGRGLGMQLLKAAEVWLHANRCITRLLAKVREENIASRKMFQRSGFALEYVQMVKEFPEAG